jgi:hypothetical protein
MRQQIVEYAIVLIVYLVNRHFHGSHVLHSNGNFVVISGDGKHEADVKIFGRRTRNMDRKAQCTEAVEQ